LLIPKIFYIIAIGIFFEESFMKKVIGLAAAFALLASTQAFAIVGVGAHYVMNLGSSLKGSSGDVYSLDFEELGEQSIKINQKSADGLRGIGFKAWLDILPVIDIEGTLNVAATRYGVSLNIPKYSEGEIVRDEIDLGYSPDAPFSMVFDKASPLYGVVNGDLSITYPFFTDNSVIKKFIRPYLGAGVSYFASIPIINASFTKKMINEDLAQLLIPKIDPETGNAIPPSPDAANKLSNALVDALMEESYKSGIGGHIIAGFRFTIPLIPLAVYANGKYYIGGNIDDQFSNGFVLEIGGGLAF
jgi:hypothetical protein